MCFWYIFKATDAIQINVKKHMKIQKNRYQNMGYTWDIHSTNIYRLPNNECHLDIYLLVNPIHFIRRNIRRHSKGKMLRIGWKITTLLCNSTFASEIVLSRYNLIPEWLENTEYHFRAFEARLDLMSRNSPVHGAPTWPQYFTIFWNTVWNILKFVDP